MLSPTEIPDPPTFYRNLRIGTLAPQAPNWYEHSVWADHTPAAHELVQDAAAIVRDTGARIDTMCVTGFSQGGAAAADYVARYGDDEPLKVAAWIAVATCSYTESLSG